MGFLTNVLDKARALLSRPPVAGTATQAVAHRALDHMVLDELAVQAPALGALVDELSVRHSGARDLVSDTVLTFFQPTPQLNGRDAMAPHRLVNWSVAKALAESPATAQTREYTRGDHYGAAIATMAVADRLQDLLHKSGDAEAEAQVAEQAAMQAAAAAQRVEDMLAQAAVAEAELEAAQAAGDDKAAAHQQAQAAAAGTELHMATEAADLAADAADIAAHNAQKAADRFTRHAAAAVEAAAAEAGEQLAAEGELIAAWGLGDGEVQYMSFDERRKLIARLRRSPVSRYLDLLGRFLYEERAARAKRVSPARDEVYSVERSGRLADLMASEIALLATPQTETEFLSRWAEDQLLTRAYQGTEKAGQGDVVMCVDTSGSMKQKVGGVSAADWSKTLALALLQRCQADGRGFVGIIFSSRNQVQTFRFPAGGYDIDQVLEFVSKDFNGGTNFEAPINVAMDILEREMNEDGKRRGDLVFLTDDEYSIPGDWLKKYQERKAKIDFRTWGIACGRRTYGHALDSISDNVRAVSEFVEPDPVLDLLATI